MRGFSSAGAATALAWTVITAGCRGPLDGPIKLEDVDRRGVPSEIERLPASTLRPSVEDGPILPSLDAHATLDDYLRYASLNNPGVEAAFQRWRAAVERVPQVGALPDPQFGLGVYLQEVETRTGPQEARLRVSQTFPWFGKLGNRKDAAAQAALAAWRRFEAVRVALEEQVLGSLYELQYVDAAVDIAEANVTLLRQFEEAIRARYRVGTGEHAEVIRAQVELGALEDRLRQLRDLRPTYVAELNSRLNRPATSPIERTPDLPDNSLTGDLDELVAISRESNPTLAALDEEIEAQRWLTEVARKDGLPDLTVGLDYIFTGEADDPSVRNSGEDPILLGFGINVPLWRGKYEAGVREATARRLAIAHARADESNHLAARLHRAWFEHTDADRRVDLYRATLIPKAEESLRASLVRFRTGDSTFLELLETERTLLEFEVAAERARADRGIARARVIALVGGSDVAELGIASTTNQPETEK